MRTDLEIEVLESIRPGPVEARRLQDISDLLIAKINDSGIALGLLVGSFSRGTWIRGQHDLDIFLLFPPDTNREDLEEKGLKLARYVIADFTDEYYEKYAEHPYLHARIGDIKIDLVPCYNLKPGSPLISAVDRTPFHTKYVKERVDSLTDDILLLKQMMKVIGTYGSDQLTGGFSGYICEILVIYYNEFHSLLEAASHWKYGTLVDKEKHKSKSFSDPLIVIDPVDPKRNVASAVTIEKMSEFIEAARAYLVMPSRNFFIKFPNPKFSCSELKLILNERGTELYIIRIKRPALIDEIIGPQMKRSTNAITVLLQEHEFVVNRSAFAMNNDECIFIFEMMIDNLPAVRRHSGPSIFIEKNSLEFFRKYRKERENVFSGPFIDGENYIVEVKRKFCTVSELIHSEKFLQIRHGKQIRNAISEGFSLTSSAKSFIPEFSDELYSFFHRSSPLLKIEQEDKEKK